MSKEESSVKQRRVNSTNSEIPRNKDSDATTTKRQSRLLSRDENLPDRPCHAAQDSLFSTSSGYTNYRGFFNLCLILLTLSNVRVALENIIKYGILIDPTQVAVIFSTPPYKSPIFWLLVLLNAFILLSLYAEKFLADGKLSEKRGQLFYIVNLAAILIVPATIILLVQSNPFASFLILGIYSIVFLKLISYCQVNQWCRSATGLIRNENNQQPEHLMFQNGTVSPSPFQPQLIKYPDNLTVSNMYYFMCAPTLCYELNFPRSPRRRKMFIIKRSVEFIFLIQFAIALCQQWIVPLLKNSLEPFIAMNYSRMLERLLKLAVPNHIIWLICFYWLFHACLNLTAELLRFADRLFYRDWWNAEHVQYFWQNWNIPVHKWCVRHLYKPMIVSGFTKFQAGCAVFFVSAFFHEFLLSVPLHLFRLWAFTGMLAQIPLNIMTKYMITGRWGNITVWLSLILGQPLCILMYVHDWYVYHYMQQSQYDASQVILN